MSQKCKPTYTKDYYYFHNLFLMLLFNFLESELKPDWKFFTISQIQFNAVAKQEQNMNLSLTFYSIFSKSDVQSERTHFWPMIGRWVLHPSERLKPSQKAQNAMIYLAMITVFILHRSKF